MFDPTLPAANTPASSAVLRNQFQGLKALVDAIPSVNSAEVDSVNTVPAGTPASVGVSLIGNTLHFTFSLPQGTAGSPGPPFANAVVDGVNSVPPGSPASVGVSFDGTDVRFTFDLPQGEAGATGAQGLPGEVTQADLNNGLLNNLNQCSSNSNAVSTLGQSADGTYSQSQMQDVLSKLDELISTLRR